MSDGKICIWRRPAETFHDLIHFLASSSCIGRISILQTCTLSLLSELSYFSFKTCFDYVSPFAAVLAANYSASTLQPTNRRQLESSESVSAVADVPENISAISQPGFENVLKRSTIQLTLLSSGRAIGIPFVPLLSDIMMYTFTIVLSRGVPSISFVHYKCRMGTLTRSSYCTCDSISPYNDASFQTCTFFLQTLK